MKKNKKRKTKLTLQSVILSFALVLIASFLSWFQDSLHPERPPEPGSPPALYTNQMHQDLRQTLVGAIDEAQESIMLIIYALTDPSIIDALKNKREAGIEVHVVCDAKASPQITKKLGNKITTIRRFGPGLMHQKILVVDQKQTWIGSANMTPESLHMHGNLVTAIHSHDFAQAVIAKGKTLQEEGHDESFLHEEFHIAGQKTELWFLPDDNKAVKHLKALIDSAKKTIRVAMFTWTRQDLAHALINAHKRGVKTEVVLDYSQANGTGAKIANLLKTSGVPTSVSQGKALLHHKFAYIDGSILVNGSANWTKAAFSQNDDCFIILHDLNADQKNMMEELWKVIKNESASLN